MAGYTLSARRCRRIVAVLALAGLVAGCSAAASAAPMSIDPLTRLVEQDVAAGAPGVIVRVDDGGGRPIEIARQAAWTTRDRRLAPGDQFRIGSNTKTVVATLVLQLVAQHRVDLADSVEKWLPGLVPNGGAITVRMLLNHTSGLFNYVNDIDVLRAFIGQDTRQWTPRELLAAAVKHDPLFAPGQEYSYSNTGYVVLGLILERATGHSVAELIQQRIAEPLGLRNTYLAPPDDFAKLAHGYEPDAAHIAPLLPPGTPPGLEFAGPDRGDFVDTTRINDSTEWAAGGMVSTAVDWARFQRALLSGRLLPPAQLREMETTVSEGPSIQDRAGLGLDRVVTPCGVVWGHDGQTAGYSSEGYTTSDGRRTVAIFTSTVFGLKTPKAGAADKAVQTAAICTMLGKPIPTTASH
jgi:D-alanyl-D-alanine carboxypeptidase